MRFSIALVSLVAATPLFCQQYKLESAGALPAEVPPSFAELMQKEGQRIVAASGMQVCELWFRSTPPGGAKSGEEGQVFPTIPHGALMGVARFTGRGGSDRRGQGLKPGVYSLRYSMHPVNGDHLGVAPQRDFLVLTPIAEDKDPAATPSFDDLMAMSRKASGTPHPAVLSISKAASDKVELVQEGETDWVLHVKFGEGSLSIIVVGKVEG